MTTSTAERKIIDGSTQAESALIGAILHDDTNLAMAFERGVTADDFAGTNQEIFLAILAVDGIVDAVTVHPRLVSRGVTEDDAAAYLGERLALLPHRYEASAYCDDVIENGRGRRLKRLCREVAAGRIGIDRVETLLNEGLKELSSIEREPPPFVSSLIDMADFCEKELTREWLIEGVLVRGEEMIVGGPDKCLKTSVIIDLIVSLAGGTYFLDQESFRVPSPARTCVMTCESGDVTIQNTVKRVARAKQVHLNDLRGMLFYGPELPIISNDWHMAELCEYIKKNRIECLVIDPTYLCLFDEKTRVQSGDILQMGPLLLRLTAIRRATGVTIILNHHTRKLTQPRWEGFHKTTRQDLAQSGFAAFMRQWLLLSRRREYQHDGRHEIHVEVGGSAGHSSEYVLEANEGKQGNVLTDWQVTITAADEFEEAKEARKEERADEQRDQTLERHVEKVGAFMREHGPEVEFNKTAIGSGTSLNPSNTERALFELKRRGKVVMNDQNPNRIKWSAKAEPDEPDKPDN